MAVETEQLPKPHLCARRFGARGISALSDPALEDACGVRIAFTGRAGGISQTPYDSLNLATHVGDAAEDVFYNRAILLKAAGLSSPFALVPNQVHGTDGVVLASSDPAKLNAAFRAARAGADFVVVGTTGIPALLCFADCASLIVVSPTGRFAVVHAGWRGAVAHIARKATKALVCADAADRGEGCLAADADLSGDRLAAGYNAYIGPHIRSECFECGADVVQRFADEFGSQAVSDASHVSLADALRTDLRQAGVEPDRIVDCGICTVCESQDYFSYRASGGVCGRHAAFAVRVR